MGVEVERSGGWPPAPSTAPLYLQKEDHNWTHFDNSVNAIYFGFMATAILVSMFLVMAIFEKFIRTTSQEISSAGGLRLQLNTEARSRFGGVNVKLEYPSPKRPVLNAREFSVLMPGDNFPTFIAHLAPVPCPRERMHWPSHQQSSNLQEFPTPT